MGKLGRFAAIFIPMGLSIASLVCIALVLYGQTTKDMKLSRDLYFFKANTTGFVSDPNFKLENLPKGIQPDFLKILQGAAQTNKMKDFYTVGFWNYCEGDFKDGKEIYTNCSEHKNFFWFNPVEVWGLQNTTAQKAFPEKMQNGLNTYEKVARWMVIAFEIALALTAAEILIGIAALFSRWGSFITTIISTASSVFLFAAALTATVMYSALVGIFATVLEPYKIQASMGRQMLATLWLGVAFSLGSGFFWLISVCCCSGKSDTKKTKVEKTPYTYERVASPYMGNSGNAHPLNDMNHAAPGSAYEPYRSRV